MDNPLDGGGERSSIKDVMLRQSRRDLFPTDGQEFDSPDGRLTARVVNNPDGTLSTGASDQA